MARLLVALVTLLLVVGAGSSASAAPRQLLPDEVEVSVTRMTPLDPQPGKTLRMSGTVRNRSDEDVTDLQVRLLLSPTPMETRSQIGTVVAGGTEKDGPPTLAVSEPIAVLSPRSSTPWSIELALDELPLTFAGVYVVGLEVIGTGEDGLAQRVGLTRTFLPWFPEGSVEPTRLAWLWPVSTVPDRALDGVQLNELTAAEMAAGGRLSRIVTQAGDARITWVFDPNTLQTAEDMIDGYELAGGDEATVGAGGPAAAEWLAAVREAAATQESVATAYALPDATALERAEMDETVIAATERAAADVSAELRTRVEEVLAWPIGGSTTPGTMRLFRDAGATDMLLSDTTLPATPALTYTPDGFTTWGGLPVSLADSGLSAALAMPQESRGDALLARQRFLAEVAMTAGELPDAPRGIVAAPDPLWSPRNTFLTQTLKALDQVPYARLVSLAAARRQATEVPRTRVPYGPEQRSAELPRDYLSAVQDQQRRARRFEAILTEPAGLGYEQAVMRQTSGLWRADEQGAIALEREVSSQLAELTSQVRVATTGTFTLPGDTGRIPVTVANDLT